MPTMRTVAAALIFSLLATPVIAGKLPSLPASIQGIWLSDDAEGRAQCKSFLAAMSADNEDAYDKLVGALVIGDTVLHAYAEYGEGDFYQPKRIKKLGKKGWRISAAVGIDGSPEGENIGTSEFDLSLDAGKLQWDMVSFNRKPVDSWDEHVYFRCADVPVGMYAN